METPGPVIVSSCFTWPAPKLHVVVDTAAKSPRRAAALYLLFIFIFLVCSGFLSSRFF